MVRKSANCHISANIKVKSSNLRICGTYLQNALLWYIHCTMHSMHPKQGGSQVFFYEGPARHMSYFEEKSA
jgi:hypothetical protein